MAKIDAYQGVRVFLTKKARKDKKNPDAPAEKIVTEHEKMFSDEGIPIKYLIAKLVDKNRAAEFVRTRF